MQVVARTAEYTIYQKRSQRYAVQSKDKQWLNGDDKVAVLRSHDLIKAPAPKAPEPEAAAEETAGAEESTDTGDTGGTGDTGDAADTTQSPDSDETAS
jgi:hypothetical protein